MKLLENEYIIIETAYKTGAVFEGPAETQDIVDYVDLFSDAKRIFEIDSDGNPKNITEDVAIAWLEHMSKDTDIETFMNYKRPDFVLAWQDDWMEEYLQAAEDEANDDEAEFYWRNM